MLAFVWRRQWHPTPVLLPGKSHGRRSLVGYSPWGRKESDTTERLHFPFAREAAQKFAKDSDSELGKIKRATQGQFSIDNRDANTPYIKRIRVVTTVEYSLED